MKIGLLKGRRPKAVFYDYVRLSDDVFLKYACLRINEVKMCLGINGVKMWDVYRVSRKGVCSYNAVSTALRREKCIFQNVPYYYSTL